MGNSYPDHNDEVRELKVCWVRVYSHRAKASQKVKKIKEQAKGIKENVKHQRTFLLSVSAGVNWP